MKRTFALLKPEALLNKEVLVEAIVQIYEHGLKISVRDFRFPDERLIQEHYSAHLKEDYYEGLVEQLVKREVLAMVLEGENAVAVWRSIMGPYKKEERELPEHRTTLRGKFMADGAPLRYNYCHGADSVEAAEREIALWFPLLVSS